MGLQGRRQRWVFCRYELLEDREWGFALRQGLHGSVGSVGCFCRFEPLEYREWGLRSSPWAFTGASAALGVFVALSLSNTVNGGFALRRGPSGASAALGFFVAISFSSALNGASLFARGLHGSVGSVRFFVAISFSSALNGGFALRQGPSRERRQRWGFLSLLASRVP